MRLKNIIFFILFLVCSQLWANTEWYSLQGKNPTINVELFLSSTCIHCHKADAYFTQLEMQNPWLKVERHVINEDKAALELFYKMLNEQKMNDFAVPSAFFCDSRWVGFNDESTSGKDILKGLTYCKKQISEQGKLDKATTEVLKHWANANLFDNSMDSTLSAPSYIMMMAFLDSLNPCAFFCLMALIALIFTENQAKKRFYGFLIFTIFFGLNHYLQQIYPTALTEFSQTRWLSVFLGLISLTLTYGVYQSWRYSSYVLAVILGFGLPLYQQTCIMNWSFITQQWLNNQSFTSFQYAMAQLSYQILYVIPFFIIFFTYQWVLKKERMRNKENMFKNIGLIYLLAINLLIIGYPSALSNLSVSSIMLLILTIIGYILTKKLNKSGD